MASTGFIKKRVLPKEVFKEDKLNQPSVKNQSCKQGSPSAKDIRVLYTNADQLTALKKIELEILVKTEKPHIVAICEVKPKNGSIRTIQDFSLQDYTTHHTNVNTRNGRGIVILTHTSISHLVQQIDLGSEYEEVCLIQIKLHGNDVMVFGCFYRSPTETELSKKNNEALNNLLIKLSLDEKFSHICFVGDFNFRTINWNSWTTPHCENNKEEKFLETIRSSFLYQHVNQPTRSRGSDNPSTIDLILSNEQDQISKLKYSTPLGKSDHSVLTFVFHCYLDIKENSTKYMYERADYAAMNNYLNGIEWSKGFIATKNGKSVDNLWNEVKDMLLFLRDQYVPKKTSGIPTWRKKGNMPIKVEIRNMIKEKKRLHRRWIRSKNEARREDLRKQYVNVRNKLKKNMTNAKIAYEKKVCEQSKENPKVFWSHLRNSLKTKTSVSPLLDDTVPNSSLKFEDEEKANILQAQFSSVFTREPSGDLPDFEKRTEKSFYLIITKEMVEKEILNLDPSKTSGPDEIHPLMVKPLKEHLLEPFLIIMNKSLNDGILPEDWKNAHVSPIYKKGSKHIASNYRPISLTSIVCKMMETIVRNSTMNHLLEENLLSTKQYGFISRRSTTTQLLHYLDKCTESISKGKVIDAVYFDFSKAFDTVPHRRLLKKLNCYGIKGKVLKWIESFLADRSQVVKVNGCQSNITSVLSGIPQGSVLGPLLFVIYINDLPDCVSLSDIYLFADDTKLVKMIDSLEDSKMLQNDIDSLVQWSNKWLLKFHPNKCHVLTLGKFENIKHAHQYKIDDKILEHVECEKDLGVFIDSDLSFENHISEKVKVANNLVGLIRRSFFHLSTSLFKQLFTSFVRPHLEYAQAVWHPHLRKNINQIENVQRRATKLVKGISNLSYEDRLKKIGLPTLEQRRSQIDMIEVYKHLNFYDKSTIPERFKPRLRPSRQHNFQLQRNFPNDGVRGPQSTSFYFRTIKPWNELPRNIVNCKSIKHFKKYLSYHTL